MKRRSKTLWKQLKNCSLKKLRLLLPLLLIPAFIPASLHSQSRVPWTLDASYAGPLQEEFKRLQYEIPIFLRQTTIDLSSKIGLPYSEGWRFPLTVRFVDQTVVPSENLLAYVRLFSTATGIEQELVINLNAYRYHQYDYQEVLAHELVHAMLNDSLGARAASYLPLWFNEGLAVYGSGEGEDRLTETVQGMFGFGARGIVNGLEGPHGATDYTEDYLAFKYIEDRHGTNAISLLVNDVIARKGNVKAAIEYVLNMSWTEFQEDVREYSNEVIANVDPPGR